MPQTIDLPIRGVFTSPNEHGEVPKGALHRGDDVVLSREGILEKRRGQGPGISSGAAKIWPFADRLLLHAGSTLSYTDAAVTSATPYEASITAPAGRRLRAAQQNGNLYLAAAEATQRLDLATSAPVPAGVPFGLDVQGVLTGGSGFMANNSALAYRVLWKTTDANGNVLRGAPSGRAVVTNNAGGSRDVIVSTSIPSGLSSAHRWELYRSPGTDETGGTYQTEPTDEMGLVYEGAAPATAAVTQLARTTNVVTATTAAAHGFATGQIVRIAPGGGPPGHAVAIGSNAAVARSTNDGGTYSAAGISGLPTATIYGAASSGAVDVVVGTDVATSPDGLTFTGRTPPARTWRAVAFGNGRFVAVGDNGATMYSLDSGATWTLGAVFGSGIWDGVAVIFDGSLFVAIFNGQDAQASGTQWRAAYSLDGVTWYAAGGATSGSIPRAYGLVFTGTRYVAVGKLGTTAYAWSSPDRLVWTAVSLADAGQAGAVCWTGAAAVAVGTTGKAYYSTTGAAPWSSTALAGTWNACTWDSVSVIAVGSSVAATATADGHTWTSRTIPAATYYALVAGGGAPFASGDKLLTATPSGTTFTYAETGADAAITQAQTATPLTAIVLDQIPSTFAGATLYTSPSQEGALAAHYLPPLANDVASFRGSVFYLGTTTSAALGFWVLAAGAPSGVQVNDTITINGMVFTAKASETISSREFAIFTSDTAAVNVRNTAASLMRVVNRAQGSLVYATDLSSVNDQPGNVQLAARANTYAVTISVSRASAFGLTDGSTKAPETNTHRLAWTPKNMPDAMQPTAWQDVGEKKNGGIRLIALRDSLFVLKNDGIWRCTGDGFSYQNGPVIAPFDTNTIVVAPETAVALDNVIVALSNKGVVQISDTGVTILSRPIKDQIDALLVEPMLTTVRGIAHAVAYEADGKYILWVPTSSSDTVPTRALVYDHLASLARNEPVWTMRTDTVATGTVNPYDGRLYTADASKLYRERKAGDYTDYADGEVAVTVSSVTGASAVLSSASGVAAGDMLVQGAARGVVLSVATNTLTLDRPWAGTPGAATVYKAIGSVAELAPIIPVPGAWAQFMEAAFLFRHLAGGYIAVDFSTELAPTRVAVSFYGTRDYGLSETALAPVNLRTWIPRDQQRAARMKIRITHSQAWSPMALEGVSVAWAPTSLRLRR